MLKDILLLQTFSYSGGGEISSFFDSLAQTGFFSYILPFLLLFALIYGILLRTKIFEKNGINVIISLAVALLAIQFEAVPMFFSNIFPRLGIGLAIILVLLILMGLFMPNQAWMGYVLFIAVAIIFLVILGQSAGETGSDAFSWFSNNWPLIAGLVVIVVIVITLTVDKKSKVPETLGDVLPFWMYPRPEKAK